MSNQENQIDEVGIEPTDEAMETEAGIVTSESGGGNRGAMILFGVILIAAAAIWFFYLRNGPQSANAATEAQAVNAQKTIADFLGSGNESIRKMEAMLRDTEKVVSQFLSYPSATQVPLAELPTNPFRRAVAEGGPAAQDESAIRKHREEERLAMLKAVNALNLQSIMYGENRRACMVNNTLYQEGQQVDSFVVEKISPHSVVVQSGAYRFELKMQR